VILKKICTALIFASLFSSASQANLIIVSEIPPPLYWNQETITFDTEADLTNNFNVDIFSNEESTQWHNGYDSINGYDGSDGGFIHFNSYGNANSMQFLNGPVILRSFDISSQYDINGAGVDDADNNGRDFTLQLFDQNLTKIYDQSHLVSTNGDWGFIHLNINNVSVIKILPTWSNDDVYDGFWPNIDNIRYNNIQVPEPSSLAILALGLICIISRRRKV